MTTWCEVQMENASIDTTLEAFRKSFFLPCYLDYIAGTV